MFTSLVLVLFSFAQTVQPKVSLANPAPEFQLVDLNGKKTPFAQFSKDKITVVCFWSVECPITCALETRLAEIIQEYGKKEILFAVIDSNTTESVEMIQKYMAGKKLPYTIFSDARGEIANLFGAVKTPQVFVFTKKGNLIYSGAIDDDVRGALRKEERKNYLREVLDSLLMNKKPQFTREDPVGCSLKRAKI